MKFLLLLFLFSCERLTTWSTPTGGDFKLATTTGEIDTAQLRGKTLLIFFGFLNCPEICPTTTLELSRMMKLLSEKDRARVVPIFITVDPERDSLEALKTHFSHFDPGIVAARGTEEEIRKALKLFGGDFKIIKGKDPTDIFVDHTSSIFVINRKGVWVNSLDYDTKATDIRDAVNLASSALPYWSDEAKDARMESLGVFDDCDLSKTPCEYRTVKGKFEVELIPRPVKHLTRTKIIVRSKERRLTPRVADLVGLETAMGLIRPKLVKTSDTEWVGGFRLPTCDLKDMHWKLRLLLKDPDQNNFEITFKFASINEFPEPPH